MTGPGEFEHRPVLLAEVVEGLAVEPGGTYVDCTVGGGGHAWAMLERAGSIGRLLCLDADPQAIAAAEERLAAFPNVCLVNENYRHLARVARDRGFDQVDGVLFDLGVSSFQLDRSPTGFSFQREAPLDMRFSPNQPMTAADLVNGLSEPELASLIWRFGEERASRRIARAIVGARPLQTTTELAAVIERAVGRRGERIHPATRTFQALRIATNEELESLRAALPQALELLRSGGRLAVISFHSLEDRIVKEFMRQEAAGCVCPPRTPVCICGHRPRLRLVTRKPIVPSPTEQQENPRSRSAKLRVAERR